MFAVRLALLAGVWWALTPGEPASWVVGGPAVVLAAWAAAGLAAPESGRLSLAGVLRFAPYFVATSLQGGCDVAWRALHPRLPIDPAFVRHPLRLPEGSGRTFLVNAVSLLPGTLSAEVDGSTLVVHALSRPEESARGVATLETRVAALFGLDLAGLGGPA
jgi:multicomponent Na+:H+ antiporter subunit E